MTHPPLPTSSLPMRMRRRLRWIKRFSRQLYPQRPRPWREVPPISTDVGAEGQLVVRVDTIGSLSQLAVPVRELRALEVTIARWEPPMRGWSGRLGALPGLLRHTARFPATIPGEAQVSIELAQPLPWQQILDAVLAQLRPAQRLPAMLTSHVAFAEQVPSWASSSASWAIGVDAEAPSRTFDLSIGAVAPFPVASTDTGELILLGEHDAGPRWRQHCGPDQPTGRLSCTGEWQWQITHVRSRTVVVAGLAGEPLDRPQLQALAQLGAVTVAKRPDEVPSLAFASTLVQLAMNGILLHAPHLDAETESLLDKELVRMIGEPLPGAGADHIEWELRSVAQRRQAMRAHSAAFAAPQAGSLAGAARLPSVSALLVTRRPGQILPAVAAMVAQTYPELEIVLTLHGIEMPSAVREALAAFDRPIRTLVAPRECTLGEVLALASDAAGGTLLTKVDDDDKYGREHVWDLVLARMFSQATLVGKGAEFVYLQPFDTTVRRFMGSEFYTDVVAGGTMLIARSDLAQLGGWRPMPRSVDRGLLDRVINAGGLVYRTHGFGFLYTRHADGHTWDPGMDYFLRDPRRKWHGQPPYGEFGTS